MENKQWQVRFSNPKTIAPPNGYSHVVEVTGSHRTIFISGQVGLTEKGEIAGGTADFAAQAQQAFKNLGNALASCGAGFGDLVKINVYLTDMKSQLPLLRDIRDSFINVTAPPASTTVEVGALAVPGLLIEVEGIAVVPL